MLEVVHADDALIAAVDDPHVCDLGPIMAECELARVRLNNLVTRHQVDPD